MKKAYNRLVAAAALSLITLSSKAAAQGLGSQSGNLGLQGVGQQQDGLASIVGGIVNFFLGFVGLVAVLILIYGGFNMITSAGDPEKFGNGRKMIVYAIIGIIIIVISWTVVGTLLDGLSGATGAGI